VGQPVASPVDINFHNVKVLLKRFHLNGHTTGFHPRAEKYIRITLNVSTTDSGSERVNRMPHCANQLNPFQTFESRDKTLSVSIQMKAIEQYFPVVLFIMLDKVVLTFESVDEVVNCDYSSECYSAVVSNFVMLLLCLPCKLVKTLK